MSTQENELLRKAQETVKPTGIKGLCVVERQAYPDERGKFQEIYRQSELEAVSGVPFIPRQANHSVSHKDVIRGIHLEGWNKLVYPVTGIMFAALVDLRPDSETFGKVEQFIFDTSKNHRGLFIPEGIGNSICAIGEGDVNYIYLVDKEYNNDVRAVALDDPDLNIKWPVENPIISDRDRTNKSLRELFPEKFKTS